MSKYIKIAVRVDGYSFIGSGHVYRCLNLVSYIKNADVEFICKNIDENLKLLITEKYKCKLNLINKNNQNKITLDKKTWLNDTQKIDCEKTINVIKNKNIDWIIIDHYSIDKEWETNIKPYVKKIFVIDDYVNRNHYCNIILNQILKEKNRYLNYINKNCKILNGKEYIILNKIYLQNKKLNNNTKLKRINIFMGGIDKTNETLKIINKCNLINQELNFPFIFDVIVGPGNKYKEEIKNLCSKIKNFNFYFNVSNMKDIFLKSELCIGSAGITIFERCILEIPSLLICFDLNQKIVLQDFINSKVTKYIGTIYDNYLKDIEDNLKKYYYCFEELKEMKLNCKKFFNRNHLMNFSKNLNNIFHNDI